MVREMRPHYPPTQIDRVRNGHDSDLKFRGLCTHLLCVDVYAYAHASNCADRRTNPKPAVYIERGIDIIKRKYRVQN